MLHKTFGILSVWRLEVPDVWAVHLKFWPREVLQKGHYTKTHLKTGFQRLKLDLSQKTNQLWKLIKESSTNEPKIFSWSFLMPKKWWSRCTTLVSDIYPNTIIAIIMRLNFFCVSVTIYHETLKDIKQFKAVRPNTLFLTNFSNSFAKQFYYGCL